MADGPARFLFPSFMFQTCLLSGSRQRSLRAKSTDTQWRMSRNKPTLYFCPFSLCVSMRNCDYPWFMCVFAHWGCVLTFSVLVGYLTAVQTDRFTTVTCLCHPAEVSLCVVWWGSDSLTINLFCSQSGEWSSQESCFTLPMRLISVFKGSFWFITSGVSF